MLPSSTLLLKDFVDACAQVDSQGPKLEAASILGCLIGFPDYFGDMKVLGLATAAATSSSPKKSIDSHSEDSEEKQLSVDPVNREDMKTLIVQALANFVDDSANTNSRCVILCSLTCFIFDEIFNQKWNARRLNDAIRRIFKDLDFREVSV